jgi:hypothetical protein
MVMVLLGSCAGFAHYFPDLEMQIKSFGPNPTMDYVHFLTVALGSASEARYLVGLAHRLGMMHARCTVLLEPRYA